ncbi:MarR family winged helix-turn-helix transcriptional regulator [Amycolatopsis magusensis]|uniref:DNA-binding MarR family transcriptional regulator n=1 Tax=Amycolatopsis magusensis TaxID=882444 RepID=A0ABS4Q0U7_9PSEU|nr:MarR family winged helix-turn-helix transcriptional regulator [Amycolatopsis magusensis]MBP2184749.1 DNA-binding MarR family transcriptional regulator [Amycolatopsis magusensis]MDI5981608.1 MarR family winged helix-turn-helix transcriptional regulator [Amycolatopsis magusensis]
MTDALEEYRLLIADVYELAGISRRTSEDIAREAGQTAARWHVLSVLSDGPRTVPGAARRLGLTPQSVQRVVTDLLDAGQAEALSNPDHARSPLIALTDDGRATLERLFARSDNARERLLERAGVSAGELHQARETLRTLLDSLRTPG